MIKEIVVTARMRGTKNQAVSTAGAALILSEES
jgi:hypothetical protein